MLNTAQIKASLADLGLSQTALADRCGVSKEAVSNWISGESLPRPAKLKQLAEVLQTSVSSLIGEPALPEPVIAYRTRDRKPATGLANDAANEIGRHFRQLVPYLNDDMLFTSRRLKSPIIDAAYVKRVAYAVRADMGIGPTEPLSIGALIRELRAIGALLVPVFWGGDKEGHENALSVYLQDSDTSWVALNLGCRIDDFKYWLSHELGHCLTLHSFNGDDGETFAETFAKHLLFPDELAEQCLAQMRSTNDRLAVANWFAGAHGVSVVTAVRAAQRVAEERGETFEKLDTDEFFAQWRANRSAFPTVAFTYFGTDKPSALEYVVRAEEVFGTPVFRAFAEFQRHEGRRSPAFLAAALNIGLGDADALSRAMWERVIERSAARH